MTDSGQIAVQLSKVKIALFLLLGCGSVAIGIWIIGLDDAAIEAQRRWNNPFFVHAIGVLTTVFFGVGVVYSIPKLFDPSPGLVINEIGITDNSSALSAGLIPWSEITGFSVQTIHRQKLLHIHIKNPQRYVASCGPIKRLMINSGQRMGYSPIAISSNSLKIRFDDLVSLLERQLAARRT